MENTRNLLIMLFFLLLGNGIFGQLGIKDLLKLEGQIELEDITQPMGEYIILLKNSVDSSVIKSSFSDTKGFFIFEIPSSDGIFLEIQKNQHTIYTSTVFDLQSSLILPKIRIKEKTMEEFVVAKKKPFIERVNGKTILNVESSINSAGSSAFELIEKAPGVTIQSGDNILLNGKQGIIVQIDGKMIPMTGSELANYLRGIGSNNIEKIEFITNPSSKYDAAGVAIIDIRLKKDMRFGTNGSINGSFGQGVYSKGAAGLTLNHRNKKINVFGNYNYTYRKGYNQLDLEREFYQNGLFTGAFIQKNYMTFPLNDQLIRTGFDYKINPKTTLGFVVNGVYNSSSTEGHNQTNILNSTNHLNGTFTSESNSKQNDQSISSTINLKHKMDTLGQEISCDLDYALYTKQSTQYFDTRYYDLNNQISQNPYLLSGDVAGNLSIYSLKADYIKPFKKDLKLEAGIKSSYVIADNNLKFYDQSNSTPVFDTTKSNHFNYTENINSAYVSMNKAFKKWNTVFGLRIENTNIIGEQKVSGKSFDSTYIQVFPTFSGSYKMNDKHTFDFNFNSRIERPSYGQLNPFKRYLDPTTYSAGNPYLRPQTTQTAELGYQYNEKYYVNLGFSRTLNSITEVIAPVEDLVNVTAQTMINLHHVDMVYSNLSLPIDITKWWNSSVNISSYFAMYSGTTAKTTLDRSAAFSYNISTVNTFQISKYMTSELSANYQSKQLYAFDLIQPIWFVNIGFQAKVLKGKGTLRCNFTDVLFTNRIQANVTFTDYKEHFNVRRDSSVGTIAFTYRFGNSKLQGVRRSNGGAEDLKGRI